jgi:hypothetical protein
MDLPDGARRMEMAKEQQSRDAQQAELLVEARVAVFDTKKAELVAQKILAQHSTMMKVALSELVVQTAEDLRSGEIKPKDRALALAALKSVGNQLYGWDREPDIRGMEMARTSGDDLKVKSLYQHWLEGTTPPECTGAVNLALIATTPEQLTEMAMADRNQDGQRVAPATEHRGPVENPEQPRTFAPVSKAQKEEVPLGPVKQPAPPSQTVNRAASVLAPEQPVHNPPSFPDAKAAFERAKAQHRQACRLKYR